MLRKFNEKKTSTWRTFSQNLRDKYQILGMELVKHKKNSEVILLAYLESPLLKNELEKIGYDKWYADYPDGQWHGHKLSPNSRTHTILLHSKIGGLSLELLKERVYKLISDIISTRSNVSRM